MNSASAKNQKDRCRCTPLADAFLIRQGALSIVTTDHFQCLVNIARDISAPRGADGQGCGLAWASPAQAAEVGEHHQTADANQQQRDPSCGICQRPEIVV